MTYKVQNGKGVDSVEFRLFEATPGMRLVFLPDAPRFTIIAVTKDACRHFNLRRDQLVGKGVFEAFPANANDPDDTGASQMQASLEFVRVHRKAHQLPIQRYDIKGSDGNYIKRYWRAGNTPFLNNEEEIDYIIHSTEDITAEVRAGELQKLISTMEREHDLFRQATVPIQIYRGREFILEFANEPTLILWGKDKDVIGKPLEEILPEVRAQGYLDLLLQVLESGTPHFIFDAPATFSMKGRSEIRYFNTVSQPFYEEGETRASGVIVFAFDVTEKVIAKKSFEESTAQLHNLVRQSPIGICVLEAPSLISQVANDKFIEISGKKPEQIIGKMYWETFAEARPYYEKALQDVVENGVTFRAEEVEVMLIRHGKEEVINVSFVYEPLKDSEGQVRRVVVWVLDHSTKLFNRKKIEESERNLRNMILQAPVAISILKGPEFIVEIANDRMFELWGRGADELLGKSIFEGLPEVREQGYEELLRGVYTTGNTFSALGIPVTLPRNGDIDIVYINLLYEAYREADGSISGIMAVATDVTAQVVARKKIEESEEKYRSLFNSMDQGFCVLEMIFDEENRPRDYRFMEINPIFENQTGLKNAIGKTALELVPTLEKHWFELYGKVALTGMPTRFTEGSEAMARWFDVYAFRVGDDSSRKVALLFSDITERRNAEEAIRKSEQNLRNIILQAPIAMCILKGKNFLIDVANNKMFELWGISSEGVLNTPLFDAVPEAKNEGFEELITNVLETGEPFIGRELPVSLPRNGGVETVFVNLSYEAIREIDGTISGVMVMVIEVTEQVAARHKIEEVVAERTRELAQANDALLRSNKELARSNSTLEEFAYAASHDLKEPVRKIHFFSDRLRDELSGQLSDAQRSTFLRLEKAAGRMGALIDDLLMYSYVSSGVSQMEEIDLNLKLQVVLEDLELEVAEKNALIVVEPLPVIKGHRRQLQQLFQNLVGNALKYSKADVRPRITISSRKVKGKHGLPMLEGEEAEKNFNLIEVEDNGIGFESSEAERIFNVFTRLHGHSEYSGNGVGLSISRKVVENHGGYIWAESQPGEGATFKVMLPADLN